jgi:hypothetical protein
VRPGSGQVVLEVQSRVDGLIQAKSDLPIWISITAI